VGLVIKEIGATLPISLKSLAYDEQNRLLLLAQLLREVGPTLLIAGEGHARIIA